MACQAIIPETAAPEPTGVLTARPELAEQAKAFAQAARSESTRRAYQADWKVFEAWCRHNHVSPLPATTETLAAFLTEQSSSKSVATLRRYCSSIGKGHRLAGFDSPAKSAWVAEILQGIVRSRGFGGRGPKRALTGPMVSQALQPATLTTGENAEQAALCLRQLRDRAVLLVGLVTGMRSAELCGLQVGDLTRELQGIVARIRRSKTDQEGRGRFVAIPRLGGPLCPVAALEGWLEAAAIEAGPVFRGLKRNGRVRPRALWKGQVALVVKAAVADLGLDPSAFGGHSLRHGYVTQARKAGIEWLTIMEQTGHTDIRTAKMYAREPIDPFKSTKVGEVFAAFAESNLGTEK